MGSCPPSFMAEIARPSAGGTSPLKPEIQARRTRGSAHLPRALSPPAPRSLKPSPVRVPAPAQRGRPVHRPRGGRRAERPNLGASTRYRRGTANHAERRPGRLFTACSRAQLDCLPSRTKSRTVSFRRECRSPSGAQIGMPSLPRQLMHRLGATTVQTPRGRPVPRCSRQSIRTDSGLKWRPRGAGSRRTVIRNVITARGAEWSLVKRRGRIGPGERSRELRARHQAGLRHLCPVELRPAASPSSP